MTEGKVVTGDGRKVVAGDGRMVVTGDGRMVVTGDGKVKTIIYIKTDILYK